MIYSFVKMSTNLPSLTGISPWLIWPNDLEHCNCSTPKAISEAHWADLNGLVTLPPPSTPPPPQTEAGKMHLPVVDAALSLLVNTWMHEGLWRPHPGLRWKKLEMMLRATLWRMTMRSSLKWPCAFPRAEGSLTAMVNLHASEERVVVVRKQGSAA